MNDFYLIPVVFLLPLSALLVVLQVNPYNALVMRGILGAISALVYALFGAADVALTDALVGTMLSITLYAIAVRSSLKMKLGGINLDKNNDILLPIKETLKHNFMNLEVVSYTDIEALKNGLYTKEIHSAYIDETNQLLVRVSRLHELLEKVPNFEVVLVKEKP